MQRRLMPEQYRNEGCVLMDSQRVLGDKEAKRMSRIRTGLEGLWRGEQMISPGTVVLKAG